MVKLIVGDNLSVAWLGAIEHFSNAPTSTVNLSVVIEKPGEENIGIRTVLDSLLQSLGHQSTQTVANTIFPQAFYRPERGESARQRLYDLSAQARRLSSRHKSNQTGTYFSRLVDWPQTKPHFNQLEVTILKLKRELSHVGAKSSIYELGISMTTDLGELALDGTTDNGSLHTPSSIELVSAGLADRSDLSGVDLHVYAPGFDNRVMGFPCLSHISLTFHGRQLHMTAIYRNQYFVQKAYGNYLGLSRLLMFICREVGCEPGEIMCVATHAYPELSRTRLQALVKQCQAYISTNETAA